ncbi:hypothetical protein SJAG_04045 [Schizosaccharomyces japonicus yFS275]|uniref:Uncharacterized protein n=1 Tax=Schizosaccharomyces japonicus (strain yFS275 / FY16936) TaxID=402676 RepID=B6K5R9_SCHJY|nr:hypothetical protein SJAG_04045 [Schizosaccharomyces japonicus yFS275]EEB08873.1 hypothetical protein SJAG_04045 [Schizosaccharomyces japonicus yFS275]
MLDFDLFTLGIFAEEEQAVSNPWKDIASSIRSQAIINVSSLFTKSFSSNESQCCNCQKQGNLPSGETVEKPKNRKHKKKESLKAVLPKRYSVAARFSAGAASFVLLEKKKSSKKSKPDCNSTSIFESILTRLFTTGQTPLQPNYVMVPSLNFLNPGVPQSGYFFNRSLVPETTSMTTGSQSPSSPKAGLVSASPDKSTRVLFRQLKRALLSSDAKRPRPKCLKRDISHKKENSNDNTVKLIIGDVSRLPSQTVSAESVMETETKPAEEPVDKERAVKLAAIKQRVARLREEVHKDDAEIAAHPRKRISEPRSVVKSSTHQSNIVESTLKEMDKHSAGEYKRDLTTQEVVNIGEKRNALFVQLKQTINSRKNETDTSSTAPIPVNELKTTLKPVSKPVETELNSKSNTKKPTRNTGFGVALKRVETNITKAPEVSESQTLIDVIAERKEQAKQERIARLKARVAEMHSRVTGEIGSLNKGKEERKEARRAAAAEEEEIKKSLKNGQVKTDKTISSNESSSDNARMDKTNVNEENDTKLDNQVKALANDVNDYIKSLDVDTKNH